MTWNPMVAYPGDSRNTIIEWACPLKVVFSANSIFSFSSTCRAPGIPRRTLLAPQADNGGITPIQPIADLRGFACLGKPTRVQASSSKRVWTYIIRPTRKRRRTFQLRINLQPLIQLGLYDLHSLQPESLLPTLISFRNTSQAVAPGLPSVMLSILDRTPPHYIRESHFNSQLTLAHTHIQGLHSIHPWFNLSWLSARSLFSVHFLWIRDTWQQNNYVGRE